MKTPALLIAALCLASPPPRFYPARNQLIVETPTGIATRKCGRIPLDYPEMAGRAEVRMGTASNSHIYALVVAPRGSGDERKASQRLFRSEDGGRSWKGYFVEIPRGTSVAFTVLADDTMMIAAAGKLNTGEQAIFFWELYTKLHEPVVSQFEIWGNPYDPLRSSSCRGKSVRVKYAF